MNARRPWRNGLCHSQDMYGRAELCGAVWSRAEPLSLPYPLLSSPPPMTLDARW